MRCARARSCLPWHMLLRFNSPGGYLECRCECGRHVDIEIAVLRKQRLDVESLSYTFSSLLL
jgi:hypothetical protein